MLVMLVYLIHSYPLVFWQNDKWLSGLLPPAFRLLSSSFMLSLLGHPRYVICSCCLVQLLTHKMEPGYRFCVDVFPPFWTRINHLAWQVFCMHSHCSYVRCTVRGLRPRCRASSTSGSSRLGLRQTQGRSRVVWKTNIWRPRILKPIRPSYT